MTPFQQELAKIVLDKGLLALVLLGATAFLNHLLERHRAKIAYAQALGQRRIEAYYGVCEFLGGCTMRVKRIVTAVANVHQNPGDDAASRLRERVGDMTSFQMANSPKVMASAVFFTQGLADELIRAQQALGDFKAAFEAPGSAGLDWLADLHARGDLVLERSAALEHHVIEEIHQNPFEKKDPNQLMQRIRPRADR
jgi:hypothetical protein